MLYWSGNCKTILVFILGVIVGTVGPQGVVNITLNGLAAVQTMSRDAAATR